MRLVSVVKPAKKSHCVPLKDKICEPPLLGSAILIGPEGLVGVPKILASKIKGLSNPLVVNKGTVVGLVWEYCAILFKICALTAEQNNNPTIATRRIGNFTVLFILESSERETRSR